MNLDQDGVVYVSVCSCVCVCFAFFLLISVFFNIFDIMSLARSNRSHLRVSKDDLIMGERAAARTNQALNKMHGLKFRGVCQLPPGCKRQARTWSHVLDQLRISGMYVGKNMAVSKKVADNLEKAFGKAKSPGQLQPVFGCKNDEFLPRQSLTIDHGAHLRHC